MNIEIEKLPGVGPNNLKSFRSEGIWNSYDLVSYLPKKYSNYSLTNYAFLRHNEVVSVEGIVNTEIKVNHARVSYLTLSILVDDFPVRLIIFGRNYLDKVLNIGKKIIVKGKFNLYKNEINVTEILLNENTPEIKPNYGIENISDLLVTKLLKHIFNNQLVDIYETLPKELIYKHKIMPRKDALYELHFPESSEKLKLAIERLKKEEAFFHLLSYMYHLNPKLKREPIKYDIKVVKSYIDKLPYQLTLDQQNAVNDVFKDYKKNESVYRLIQGDVGSGKTFVAFLSALGAITAGYQVAFMAPTEILAKQHYENFKNLFPDISINFLSSTVKNKKEVLFNLENGSTKILFGTHSLASDSTIYHNLGLVIIDEQHKFGVETREQLINKSTTKDTIYLTATPIPRSLTLTYFGDLDTSIIKMKPVKKPEVKTHLILDNKFDEVLDILKQTSKRGEQSFIVVPAIEEGNKKYTIHSVFSKLDAFFNDENLYVIHGQLKQDEIDLIMQRFTQNPHGILLSTTIIEVGIDVKSATTIIILGADNFGLSSLHQLRGRVGRGDKPGNCYLVSSKIDTDRLLVLKDINDGFKLAEYDLKLRGPGVFSSIIQSGQYKFKYIDLSTDLNILVEMKNDAKYYITNLDKYKYLSNKIYDIK